MPPACNTHMFVGDSVPLRVLALTIASGAAVLACFVYIPPLLRPGIPVSHFRQLPASVALDLILRGCNIVRGNNVVAEDVGGTGQRDWAVLCQQDNQSSLLIYFAGSGEPAIFDTNGVGLADDPESARGIRIVDWSYVARHNPALRPLPAPKACVENEVGMASSIYCYLNGGWVRLAGAD